MTKFEMTCLATCVFCFWYCWV